MLTSSAARPGERNLIICIIYIYIGGPVRNIDLDEGPDRTPIER